MRHPKRRLRLPALIAALCAALSAAVPAVATATQLRGANMHPFWSDSGLLTYDGEFASLRAAHANSVRIDLSWEALEPARGVYDPAVASQTSSVLGDAAAHGLRVILTFWGSPCWASSAPPSVSQGCIPGASQRGVGAYPPTNAGDYAAAAQFVAGAWGSRLAALEIWNEPNSARFFNSANPAGDYTTLLKSTYPAVKAVAPGLPVLATMGGTDQAFLGQLYTDGARGSYDGLAVHPYYDTASFANLQAFRSYELSHGDLAPLWATEFGWPSNSVGLQGQASLISNAFRQLAALPYVAAAEMYEVRDEGTTSAWEDNFGMLYRNMTPKPSWAAFASTLSSLR